MMDRDMCPVCGREVPQVPAGRDVPIPYLAEANGQLWHRGCCEDDVLPFMRLNPGALGAVRVVAAARKVPDAEPWWTDEGRRRR